MISLTQLKHLADQLPTPFIIMGDLNGHNPLWGSKTTSDKGNQEGLCIFNDGTDTYLHPGNGSYSAVDLTVTDPSLLDFSWKVHDDPAEVIIFPYLRKLAFYCR